jgi:glycosyltransferase involved in cell wall biosynthesis
MSKYVIISPVRNEGRWISKTIESVAAQKILPVEYIIVDDASTDNTVSEISKYLEKYQWLKLIKLQPREPMSTAEAVVRAFNIGYEQRRVSRPDFLVKLDGDLQLTENFFITCFDEFQNHPKLGITGGEILTLHGNQWQIEKVPIHHVRGATKVYRWECWEDIEGFVPRHGWDGIDILRARMKGWESRHIPGLFVKHYRPTGKRQGGVSVRIERGHTMYYLGSHPIFVLISGIRRMFDWPYVSGGLAIIWGFFKARMNGEEQYNNRRLLQFNRNDQIRRMTFGLIDKNRQDNENLD